MIRLNGFSKTDKAQNAKIDAVNVAPSKLLDAIVHVIDYINIIAWKQRLDDVDIDCYMLPLVRIVATMQL
jgi:hypothetical protein